MCVPAEAAARRCSRKYVFLKILQNSQENTCEAFNFIKRETPTQVFFCIFCDIFKNNLFTEHLSSAAFVPYRFFFMFPQDYET